MDSSALYQPNHQESTDAELVFDSKCRAHSTPLEIQFTTTAAVGEKIEKVELKKCLSCPLKIKKTVVELSEDEEEIVITEQPQSFYGTVDTKVKLQDDSGQCSKQMNEEGQKGATNEVTTESNCYCHVESSWRCVSYCFCYDCFLATLYHSFWEDTTFQYPQDDACRLICSDEGSCTRNMQKAFVLCMCAPCVPCAIGRHVCNM